MTPIRNEDDLRNALAAARNATILARSLANERDAEIVAVKARFDAKIKAREDEAEESAKAVRVYATANRKTLLKAGAKSFCVSGHTLGWRDNGGAIKTAKGCTEKKLLERILAVPGLSRHFVRNKPSLDKEAMKTKWASFKARLMKLGAVLKHEETFFLELDVSEAPAPAAKAA